MRVKVPKKLQQNRLKHLRTASLKPLLHLDSVSTFMCDLSALKHYTCLNNESPVCSFTLPNIPQSVR